MNMFFYFSERKILGQFIFTVGEKDFELADSEIDKNLEFDYPKIFSAADKLGGFRLGLLNGTNHMYMGVQEPGNNVMLRPLFTKNFCGLSPETHFIKKYYPDEKRGLALLASFETGKIVAAELIQYGSGPRGGHNQQSRCFQGEFISGFFYHTGNQIILIENEEEKIFEIQEARLEVEADKMEEDETLRVNLSQFGPKKMASKFFDFDLKLVKEPLSQVRIESQLEGALMQRLNMDCYQNAICEFYLYRNDIVANGGEISLIAPNLKFYNRNSIKKKFYIENSISKEIILSSQILQEKELAIITKQKILYQTCEEDTLLQLRCSTKLELPRQLENVVIKNLDDFLLVFGEKILKIAEEDKKESTTILRVYSKSSKEILVEEELGQVSGEIDVLTRGNNANLIFLKENQELKFIKELFRIKVLWKEEQIFEIEGSKQISISSSEIDMCLQNVRFHPSNQDLVHAQSLCPGEENSTLLVISIASNPAQLNPGQTHPSPILQAQICALNGFNIIYSESRIFGQLNQAYHDKLGSEFDYGLLLKAEEIIAFKCVPGRSVAQVLYSAQGEKRLATLGRWTDFNKGVFERIISIEKVPKTISSFNTIYKEGSLFLHTLLQSQPQKNNKEEKKIILTVVRTDLQLSEYFFTSNQSQPSFVTTFYTPFNSKTPKPLHNVNFKMLAAPQPTEKLFLKHRSSFPVKVGEYPLKHYIELSGAVRSARVLTLENKEPEHIKIQSRVEKIKNSIKISQNFESGTDFVISGNRFVLTGTRGRNALLHYDFFLPSTEKTIELENFVCQEAALIEKKEITFIILKQLKGQGNKFRIYWFDTQTPNPTLNLMQSFEFETFKDEFGLRAFLTQDMYKNFLTLALLSEERESLDLYFVDFRRGSWNVETVIHKQFKAKGAIFQISKIYQKTLLLSTRGIRTFVANIAEPGHELKIEQEIRTLGGGEIETGSICSEEEKIRCLLITNTKINLVEGARYINSFKPPADYRILTGTGKFAYFLLLAQQMSVLEDFKPKYKLILYGEDEELPVWEQEVEIEFESGRSWFDQLVSLVKDEKSGKIRILTARALKFVEKEKIDQELMEKKVKNAKKNVEEENVQYWINDEVKLVIKKEISHKEEYVLFLEGDKKNIKTKLHFETQTEVSGNRKLIKLLLGWIGGGTLLILSIFVIFACFKKRKGRKRKRTVLGESIGDDYEEINTISSSYSRL